jgi:hypothetical protein
LTSLRLLLSCGLPQSLPQWRGRTSPGSPPLHGLVYQAGTQGPCTRRLSRGPVLSQGIRHEPPWSALRLKLTDVGKLFHQCPRRGRDTFCFRRPGTDAMRPPARWTCDRKSRDPARFGDILEGMPAAQPADAVAWHHKLPMIPCELPVGGGTELTEQARAVAKAARDAAIVAGREAGKSNREIARDIGVPRRPVDRVDTGPKENTSDLAHPPILSAVAARKLDELASPPAQNWSVAGGTIAFRRQSG